MLAPRHDSRGWLGSRCHTCERGAITTRGCLGTACWCALNRASLTRLLRCFLRTALVRVSPNAPRSWSLSSYRVDGQASAAQMTLFYTNERTNGYRFSADLSRRPSEHGACHAGRPKRRCVGQMTWEPTRYPPAPQIDAQRVLGYAWTRRAEPCYTLSTTRRIPGLRCDGGGRDSRPRRIGAFKGGNRPGPTSFSWVAF